MQAQGVETDGLPLNTAHMICKQGPDIDTLSGAVARAIDAYTTAHPTAGLIDLNISGGGAGNTFMAQLLVHPGNGVPTEEQLVNQVFKWFTASDFHTLETKMNAYLATLTANDALWAWSVSSAGAGAVWLAVMLTWQPGEG